jgi:hypothetical protein
MVPWQTLILLTVAFFIREVYQRSKAKPTDYDSGYQQAIRDIAYKFNAIKDLKISDREFLTKLRDYLQAKLNGGG